MFKKSIILLIAIILLLINGTDSLKSLSPLSSYCHDAKFDACSILFTLSDAGVAEKIYAEPWLSAISYVSGDCSMDTSRQNITITPSSSTQQFVSCTFMLLPNTFSSPFDVSLSTTVSHPNEFLDHNIILPAIAFYIDSIDFTSPRTSQDSCQWESNSSSTACTGSLNIPYEMLPFHIRTTSLLEFASNQCTDLSLTLLLNQYIHEDSNFPLYTYIIDYNSTQKPSSSSEICELSITKGIITPYFFVYPGADANLTQYLDTVINPDTNNTYISAYDATYQMFSSSDISHINIAQNPLFHNDCSQDNSTLCTTIYSFPSWINYFFSTLSSFNTQVHISNSMLTRSLTTFFKCSDDVLSSLSVDTGDIVLCKIWDKTPFDASQTSNTTINGVFWQNVVISSSSVINYNDTISATWSDDCYDDNIPACTLEIVTNYIGTQIEVSLLNIPFPKLELTHVSSASLYYDLTLTSNGFTTFGAYPYSIQNNTIKFRNNNVFNSTRIGHFQFVKGVDHSYPSLTNAQLSISSLSSLSSKVVFQALPDLSAISAYNNIPIELSLGDNCLNSEISYCSLILTTSYDELESGNYLRSLMLYIPTRKLRATSYDFTFSITSSELSNLEGFTTSTFDDTSGAQYIVLNFPTYFDGKDFYNSPSTPIQITIDYEISIDYSDNITNSNNEPLAQIVSYQNTDLSSPINLTLTNSTDFPIFSPSTYVITNDDCSDSSKVICTVTFYRKNTTIKNIFFTYYAEYIYDYIGDVLSESNQIGTVTWDNLSLLSTNPRPSTDSSWNVYKYSFDEDDSSLTAKLYLRKVVNEDTSPGMVILLDISSDTLAQLISKNSTTQSIPSLDLDDIESSRSFTFTIAFWKDGWPQFTSAMSDATEPIANVTHTFYSQLPIATTLDIITYNAPSASFITFTFAGCTNTASDITLSTTYLDPSSPSTSYQHLTLGLNNSAFVRQNESLPIVCTIIGTKVLSVETSNIIFSNLEYYWGIENVNHRTYSSIPSNYYITWPVTRYHYIIVSSLDDCTTQVTQNYLVPSNVATCTITFQFFGTPAHPLEVIRTPPQPAFPVFTLPLIRPGRYPVWNEAPTKPGLTLEKPSSSSVLVATMTVPPEYAIPEEPSTGWWVSSKILPSTALILELEPAYYTVSSVGYFTLGAVENATPIVIPVIELPFFLNYVISTLIYVSIPPMMGGNLMKLYTNTTVITNSNENTVRGSLYFLSTLFEIDISTDFGYTEAMPCYQDKNNSQIFIDRQNYNNHYEDSFTFNIMGWLTPEYNGTSIYTKLTLNPDSTGGNTYEDVAGKTCYWYYDTNLMYPSQTYNVVHHMYDSAAPTVTLFYYNSYPRYVPNAQIKETSASKYGLSSNTQLSTSVIKSN